MSNMFLIACVSAAAVAVALILVRAVSTRLVQSRHERLKAHLDWVNPVPQTRRKRALARR